MVLLRGSGDFTGQHYDFAVVMDGTGDGGVPHGKLLMDFGAAVVGDSADRLNACRIAVQNTLGADALADAAGIAAIFNAVVRLADATGIPLEDAKEAASRVVRAEIGIDAFAVGKD
ncbi:MAG: hypothetical protein KIT36_13655 [Alphaproteobacteria bacterium]|nr:hypothetical protein [Alphaproteobacteria bacterium]